MAITAGATGKGSSAGGVADTYVLMSVTGTPSNGSFIFVSVAIQDPTVTVSSFIDDSTGGPMTFTQICDTTFNGLRHQAWGTGVNGGKAGFTDIKINFTGTVLAAACWTEWLGALAFGNCVPNTGTNADPTVSVTTQDANNFVVAGFSSVGSTLATVKTGTFDRSTTSNGGSPVAQATAHNTAASPGSVTVAVTLAATTWTAVGYELRSVAPSGGSAQPGLMLLGIGS